MPVRGAGIEPSPFARWRRSDGCVAIQEELAHGRVPETTDDFGRLQPDRQADPNVTAMSRTKTTVATPTTTGASSVIALAVATWAVRNPWHLAAAPVVVGVAAVVFVLFVAVTLGFGLSRWTPFWGERGERRELRAVRRGW